VPERAPLALPTNSSLPETLPAPAPEPARTETAPAVAPVASATPASVGTTAPPPGNSTSVDAIAPKQSDSQQPQNQFQQQASTQDDGTQQDSQTDTPRTTAAVKPKASLPHDDAPAPQPVAASALDTRATTTVAPTASPTPAPALATAAQAPAPANATDALRSADSATPAAPAARVGTVQEISIRVEQPDASPVDLRVIERSGQVHVDVRTNDVSMQASLRQDLGSLTTSLQKAGYHAETFTPASASARAVSAGETGNQANHQDSSRNGGSQGDSSQGRRQQQQQKRTGNWLEEQEEQS
jgi:hypothetical protein